MSVSGACGCPCPGQLPDRRDVTVYR